MFYKTTKDKVFEDIDQNFLRYLDEVRELVRQPSVAAQNIGIEKCAQMVADHIHRLGSTNVQLIRYPEGNPIVYGTVKSKDPQAKSLIIYCLYDVQPPDPLSEWIVNPYAAEIVDLPKFGPSVVGRGTRNSKGPLVGTFKAIESMQRVMGDVPLNLIFIIEGEEEAGSINLKKFVPEYLQELSTAKGVYLPGLRQDENGKVILMLGTKGILYFELEMRGGDWGGPRNIDIHSKNASWVDNPIRRMASALSTLWSPEGRVLIEGFYEHVAPISEADQRLIKSMTKTFDPEVFKQALNVSRFMGDLEGEELIKQHLYVPSLNIEGIYGGYTGEWQKTIIPYRVRVKFDCRTVPNMDGDDIMKKIMDHFRKHGYEDIKVVFSKYMPWGKCRTEADFAQAAIRAMEASGVEKTEIWPFAPGDGPQYLFSNMPLHIPFIPYGLGHGGKNHAPNEYLVIDGLRENIKSVAAIFLEYLEILHQKHLIANQP